MTGGPAPEPTRRRAWWRPFTRVSVATILVAVLLVSLIPTATLLVAIKLLDARSRQRQQEATLYQTETVLVAIIGARLRSAEVSVATLARQGYANPTSFTGLAKSLLESHRHWQRLLWVGADNVPLAVVERRGTAVAVLVPSSAKDLHGLPDPQKVRLVPFVTTTGDIEVDVGVPIGRDGRGAGALWLRTVVLPANGIGTLMALFRHHDVALVRPDGGLILTQGGTIHARSIPPAAGAGTETAVRAWRSPEWGSMEVAVERIPGAEWSVAAIAATDTRDPMFELSRNAMWLVALAVLLPMLAAGFLARLLQRRMAGVAAAAHALTGDMPLAAPLSGVVEIDAIQEALTAARQALAERASSRERLHAAELAMLRSQRAQAISLLMSAVAHDFGNLAFAISAQLERLRHDDADEARRGTVIDAALQLAREASRIVSDLAHASRMHSPETSPTSIDGVIADSLALLRRAAGHGIEVRHRRATTSWLADINPTMMRSALFNLVVNAAAAMPRGGMVSIATLNTTLGIDNAWKLASGDYIHLTVTDSGDGIPPDMVEAVFDPFFTTREVGEGNGLGLATVREFVLRASGAVTVESQPEAGTTFHLLFPRWAGVDPNPQG